MDLETSSENAEVVGRRLMLLSRLKENDLAPVEVACWKVGMPESWCCRGRREFSVLVLMPVLEEGKDSMKL